MNYIINPAVALMNRLPMVYKFSLISILFLGPIIVLSWLVISGLNQSVQTMTRGIEGLAELHKVERLLVAERAGPPERVFLQDSIQIFFPDVSHPDASSSP